MTARVVEAVEAEAEETGKMLKPSLRGSWTMLLSPQGGSAGRVGEEEAADDALTQAVLHYFGPVLIVCSHCRELQVSNL